MSDPFLYGESAVFDDHLKLLAAPDLLKRFLLSAAVG